MDLFTKRCGCGTIINVKTACCDGCLAKRRAEVVALAGPKQRPNEVFIGPLVLFKGFSTLEKELQEKSLYGSKWEAFKKLFETKDTHVTVVAGSEGEPKSLAFYKGLAKEGDATAILDHIEVDGKTYPTLKDYNREARLSRYSFQYQDRDRLVAAKLFSAAYKEVPQSTIEYVRDARKKNIGNAKTVWKSVYFSQIAAVQADLSKIYKSLPKPRLAASFILETCYRIKKAEQPETARQNALIFMRQVVAQEEQIRAVVYTTTLSALFDFFSIHEDTLVEYIQHVLRD